MVNATDLFPVGNLSGIYLTHLFSRQVLDGIFGVDDKYQCVGGGFVGDGKASAELK